MQMVIHPSSRLSLPSILPSTPTGGTSDLLSCVDCFGRVSILRLPSISVPASSDLPSSPLAPLLGLAPPSSLSSREAGWASATLQRGVNAVEAGGGMDSRAMAATALRFGKAAAIYDLASASSSVSLGGSPSARSATINPLRVFHTLGYPTALCWAQSLSGGGPGGGGNGGGGGGGGGSKGKEAQSLTGPTPVLSIAEEGRVTIWDVRQVWGIHTSRMKV